MKFNVNQQDLQKSLNYCQGVIEKRSTLQILSNVLLEASGSNLTVTATDLDLIFIHKIKNHLSPNEVIIIEFKSNNHFSLTADIKNNLAPISNFQALKVAKANFTLNTNFYGENAIGEIIIDKKRFGSENKNASGFFKVIDENWVCITVNN